MKALHEVVTELKWEREQIDSLIAGIEAFIARHETAGEAVPAPVRAATSASGQQKRKYTRHTGARRAGGHRANGAALPGDVPRGKPEDIPDDVRDRKAPLTIADLKKYAPIQALALYAESHNGLIDAKKAWPMFEAAGKFRNIGEMFTVLKSEFFTRISDGVYRPE